LYIAYVSGTRYPVLLPKYHRCKLPTFFKT